MSNLSVCRLSFQYVNLHLIYFIYLFQPRPARNSSKYYFFSRNPSNPWINNGVRGYDGQPHISTSLYFTSSFFTS